jgi:hypothetical protein
MRAPIRPLSVAVLLAGCGGANAGQADPQACAPVEAPASDLSADGLAGAYSVQLVATAGAKQGARAAGRLELMALDSSYQAATEGSADPRFGYPLHGTAEVDFAAVGATTAGDPASADPTSPGVLVIQRPGGVMLRLGADANRPGVRRFDGGYTVLEVHQVTEGGFAGTWRSAVELKESSGYFCAVRAS